MNYRSGKCLYQLEVVSPVAGGGSTGGSCLTQGKFRQSNIGGPSVNNTTHTHHHILSLTQVMAGEVRGCQETNRWSISLHRKHIIIAYRNLYESIQDPIHHVMNCLIWLYWNDLYQEREETSPWSTSWPRWSSCWLSTPPTAEDPELSGDDLSALEITCLGFVYQRSCI